MRRLNWIALSVAATSCSPSAKPEPPAAPQSAKPQAAEAPPDAIVSAAIADAPSALTDERRPIVFPWAVWRERNEKWLANPTNDHCDPRNRHVRRKGESECYPPSNVQLAGIVIRAQRAQNDDAKSLLTIDRGYSASVTVDYFMSLLDADGRPATKWVHPSHVESDFSQFELPTRLDVPVERGITHAAIVERLTTEDRFPDDDPRSQP